MIFFLHFVKLKIIASIFNRWKYLDLDSNSNPKRKSTKNQLSTTFFIIYIYIYIIIDNNFLSF